MAGNKMGLINYIPGLHKILGRNTSKRLGRYYTNCRPRMSYRKPRKIIYGLRSIICNEFTKCRRRKGWRTSRETKWRGPDDNKRLKLLINSVPSYGDVKTPVLRGPKTVIFVYIFVFARVTVIRQNWQCAI